MKIKATVFFIDLIPENDKDIKLLKDLFIRLSEGNPNYTDFELLNDGTLAFQIS